MSAVAAIVLAAGRSTRMGVTNKLLVALAGRPLVTHAVKAALGSSARPVLVVTGHEAADVAGALQDLSVEIVVNPLFAEGLSTSLKAGIAALPASVAGAIVLLGDMPRLTAPVIDGLIGVFEAHPEAAAVVPVYGGQRGNPVLLGRKLFAEVGTLTGDEGARRLLRARADVIEWHVADPAVGLDIDTPEALAELAGGSGASKPDEPS